MSPALLLIAALAVAAPEPAPSAIHLTSEQARAIGMKIWHNETGGRVDFLTWWNKNEDFPSMGICHFIWYPKGYEGRFEETFPKLLAALEAGGADVPKWLRDDPHCPWKDRDQFYKDIDSPRMNELRRLLTDTVDLQARWAADRLEAALPKMLEAAPAEKRAGLRRQFDRVARVPAGVYALVDYLNFKGEGVSPKERYGDDGWGLLQVLEGMSGNEDGTAALGEFRASAERVLRRRVENAPPERRDGERRWLKNWLERVGTYKPDA